MFPSGEIVEEYAAVFNVRLLVEDKTVVSLIVVELPARVVSMNGVEVVTVEKRRDKHSKNHGLI